MTKEHVLVAGLELNISTSPLCVSFNRQAF